MSPTNEHLAAQVDAIALDVGLSGAIRVDVGGRLAHQQAYGLADRRHGIANTVDHQYGIASGTKGFTALAVMTCVERGELALDQRARTLLGDDLPLIDDRVTVEQLLTHYSGVGDYVDEEAEVQDEYPMTVPVHRLDTTEHYLPALDGYPSKFPPGERFAYCNGGFVVLALLAERATQTPFHKLVAQRVCAPAGMSATEFLRSDELPARAATGYVDDDGLRTNVLHLPVRGSGDGGAYTTLADCSALWAAFMAGRIVSPATVTAMVQPRGGEPGEQLRYGLGLWLDDPSGTVSVHGFDVGACMVSVHDLDGRYTFTVTSNKTRGAWPTAQRLGQLLTT